MDFYEHDLQAANRSLKSWNNVAKPTTTSKSTNSSTSRSYVSPSENATGSTHTSHSDVLPSIEKPEPAPRKELYGKEKLRAYMQARNLLKTPAKPSPARDAFGYILPPSGSFAPTESHLSSSHRFASEAPPTSIYSETRQHSGPAANESKEHFTPVVNEAEKHSRPTVDKSKEHFKPTVDKPEEYFSASPEATCIHYGDRQSTPAYLKHARVAQIKVQPEEPVMLPCTQSILNQIQDLQTEVESYKTELDTLKIENAELYALIEDHVEEEKTLRQEIEIYKTENFKLQAKLDRVGMEAREKIQALEAKVQEMGDALMYEWGKKEVGPMTKDGRKGMGYRYKYVKRVGKEGRSTPGVHQ